MKKMNLTGNEKQRFSIKKYSIGVVSVLVGVTFFSVGGNVSQIAYALENANKVNLEKKEEEKTNKISVNYKFVADKELNKEERKLLKDFIKEEEKAVKENKTYYFVYKANDPSKIPYAGTTNLAPLWYAASASLIIFSLVVLKDRKNTGRKLKVATSVFILSSAVTLAALNVHALENILLEKFNKSIMVEEGKLLPNPPKMIENYSFTGFYLSGDDVKQVVDSKTGNEEGSVSNDKEEKETFVEEEIGFETEFVADPSLPKGSKKISSYGKKGVIRFRMIGGKRVASEILVKPESKIITVGADKKAKISEETVISHKTIDFKEQTVDSDEVWEGEVQIIPGKQGVVEVKTKYLVIDGERQQNPEVEEKEIEKPKDRIIKNGTKPIKGEIVEVETQEMDFAIEEVPDPTRKLNERHIEIVGKKGTKKLVKTYETTKGVKEALKSVKEEIVEQPRKQVVKVGTKTEDEISTVTRTERQPIEYEEKIEYDNNKWEGDVEVTEGQNGILEISKTYTIINGVEQPSPVIVQKIIKDKKDKITIMGRKPIEGEVLETRVEEVRYNIVEKADPTREKDTKHVEKPGVPGRNRVTTKYKTIRGVKTDVVIEEVVEKLSDPEDEIVLVGSQEVGTEVVTTYRDVDFEIIEREDREKYTDYAHEVEPGQKGRIEITTTYKTVNGQRTTEIINTSEREITEKKDRIIIIGTKPIVGEEIVEEVVEIDFETVEVPTNTLRLNERRPKKAGEKGRKTVVKKYETNRGVRTGRIIETTEKDVVPAVAAEEYVGTRVDDNTKYNPQPVTPNVETTEGQEVTAVSVVNTEGIPTDRITSIEWKQGEKPNFTQVGEQNGKVLVTYIDRTTDEVSVTVKVNQRVTTPTELQPPMVVSRTVTKKDTNKGLTVSLRVIDTDSTIISIDTEIQDEAGRVIKKINSLESDLVQKENGKVLDVEITGLKQNIKYKVVSKINYNTSQETEEVVQTLTNENEDRYIFETKEIQFETYKNARLYAREAGQTVRITTIEAYNQMPQNHFVEIELNGGKKVIAGVRNVVEKQGLVGVLEVELENGEKVLLKDNNSLNWAEVDGYVAENEKAYENISKLVPLYNKEHIVKLGNELPRTANLFTKVIDAVLPMSGTNVLDTVHRIGKEAVDNLLVVYKDGSQYITEKLPIAFKQLFEGIPEYTVTVGDKETEYTLLRNTDVELKEKVEAVATEFSSIDFIHNEKIKNMLMPQYTSLDRISKRNEMMKTNPSVTNEEIEEALRIDYLTKLGYKENFDKVKNDINSIIGVVESSAYVMNKNQAVNEILDEIIAEKEKLVLALSYLDRLYSVKYGDINIKNVVAYNPHFFGGKVRLAEMLKELGTFTYQSMKMQSSDQTFKAKLGGKISPEREVVDFLEKTLSRLIPGKKVEDWFVESSNAVIVETPSEQDPTAEVRLYNKLKNATGHNNTDKSKILPLLSLPTKSVYVLVNMFSTTYGSVGTYLDEAMRTTNETQYNQEIAKFVEKAKAAGKEQASFIDLMYRTAKEEKRNILTSNRLIQDGMKKYTTNKFLTTEARWSKEFGPEALEGVRDFITPFNMWYKSGRFGAEANGMGVRYFIDEVVSPRGTGTYTHEVTHLLDREVWFAGNGRREGLGAEVYARGLYEVSSDQEDKYFNLNLAFEKTEENQGVYNKSAKRFATTQDLKEYMERSFDVLYTMDYIEGKILTGKTAKEKALWFKKLSQVEDRVRNNKTYQGNQAVKPVHKLDNFTELTEVEAENINTVEDLVDRDLVARRYVIKGTNEFSGTKTNDYFEVDMFAPFYAAAQNDEGVAGDISVRRNAFDLLAEFGYYEGWVPYLSNQYANQAHAENQKLSDTYILGKVFEGTNYTSMKDFKKKMLQRRGVENAGRALKSVQIEIDGTQKQIVSVTDIENIINEAIRKDMQLLEVGAKPTNVDKVKKLIYTAYLKVTNDFTSSMYQ